MHLVVSRGICIAFFLIFEKIASVPSKKALERYKSSFWCIDQDGIVLKCVKISVSLLLNIAPVVIFAWVMEENMDWAKLWVNGSIWIANDIVSILQITVELCFVLALIMMVELPIFLTARLWIFGQKTDPNDDQEGKSRTFLKRTLAVIIAVEIVVVPALTYILSTRFEDDQMVITNENYIAKKISYSDATVTTNYGFSPEDDYFFVYLDLYEKNGVKIDLVELCNDDDELLLEVYNKLESAGVTVEKATLSAKEYETAKAISKESADTIIDNLFQILDENGQQVNP